MFPATPPTPRHKKAKKTEEEENIPKPPMNDNIGLKFDNVKKNIYLNGLFQDILAK